MKVGVEILISDFPKMGVCCLIPSVKVMAKTGVGGQVQCLSEAKRKEAF